MAVKRVNCVYFNYMYTLLEVTKLTITINDTMKLLMTLNLKSKERKTGKKLYSEYT